MKIAGLDPSLTGFGVAVMRDDLGAPPGRSRATVMTWRLDPGKLRGHERIAFLLDGVMARCAGADLAVIEGLAYAAKGNSLLDLAGLAGVVRHQLWTLHVPYAVIPPPNLKQWATGSAAADKCAMVAAAVRRFPGLPVNTGDEADALWALAAGCEHAGCPITDMPKAQVAALSAVHSGKGKRGQPKIVWPADGGRGELPV